MDFPALTPVEAVMADLGMMVRKGRNGVLPFRELASTVDQMKIDLVSIGADPSGHLRARLTLLKIKAEAQTLTSDQFEEITGSIRVRLAELRSSPMPVVPNFAVLPSGVHGRRIGFLTVVEGGASTHAQPTLKGA